MFALTWSFMSTSNFGYLHQVFKIQPFFSDCLNLEEGTNWSSQNVIITTNLCLITSQKSKDLSHWKVIQIMISWVITPSTVFQRNILPLSSVWLNFIKVEAAVTERRKYVTYVGRLQGLWPVIAVEKEEVIERIESRMSVTRILSYHCSNISPI
jgi:hypothetical protein